MLSEQTKVCEKKLKTAELKLNKIINKIDTLKLNNYYISNLNVSANKRWNIHVLNGGLKKCLLFCSIFLLVVGVWWISFDPYTNVSTYYISNLNNLNIFIEISFLKSMPIITYDLQCSVFLII